MKITLKEGLKGDLAETLHWCWAKWMKELIEAVENNDRGESVIPTDVFERWKQEIQLPEGFQSARPRDMEAAQKVLDLIKLYEEAVFSEAIERHAAEAPSLPLGGIIPGGTMGRIFGTEEPPEPNKFEKELEQILNRHNKDNDTQTPDFILAQYLLSCMEAYRTAQRMRQKWFGGSNGRREEYHGENKAKAAPIDGSSDFMTDGGL